jgi:hypothetical protein
MAGPDALHPSRATPVRGRRAWLLAALASVAAGPLRAAVNPDRMSDLQALAPPGAVPLEARGPWDVAIATATSGLADALKRDHGPLSFHRWRADAGLALADVEAKLQAMLGDEWESVPGLPRETAGAQMRGWRPKRGADRRPAFALAWLEDLVKVDAGPPARLILTAATRRE